MSCSRSTNVKIVINSNISAKEHIYLLWQMFSISSLTLKFEREVQPLRGVPAPLNTPL